MYKTQQSYDEMNDDFIQFDSDMSHVDLDDLFDLADSITVKGDHVINDMWADDDKYTWQDVANCLRDNFNEIKDLVSWDDRDKMSDFAFDNHFEWVNMINQILDALQNKSAYVSELNKNEFFIEFKTNMNSKIIATIQKGSNHVDFNNLSNGVYFRSYIKEADLMAMIYYINEYGE